MEEISPARAATFEHACCIAWSLSKATKADIAPSRLKALHLEIQACSEIVGAIPVEACATHGVLKIDSETSNMVTIEDSAVRLGQLLCRWGAEQDPACCIQIGVHSGELKTLALPGLPCDGCFGEALNISRALAENAPKDLCIHLLKSTKERLAVFEQLPFIISSSAYFMSDPQSYYLDWWAEGPNMDSSFQDSLREHRMTQTRFELPQCVQDTLREGRKTGSRLATLNDLQEPMSPSDIEGQSLDHFTSWLEQKGIDTSKFGRGQAKRLEDFYKEIVVQKRSYLVEEGGTLARKLELVRINLCATDASGTERTLKIAMEILDDGRTRRRDQKLATVVPEGLSWKEAVRNDFTEKFQLSAAVQEETISVKDNWFKEERKFSPSIPGIETTYLTHEVRMCVLNPQHPDLRAIGLPSMKNFATTNPTSGKQSHWTWVAAGEASDDADQLTQLLLDHGINPSEFEPGAFNDLLEEVYETRISELAVCRGELLRHLQIIKVWLSTDILSVPHVLVTVAKLQKGKRSIKIKDRPISMRMALGQAWQDALRQALTQRLGLDVSSLQKVLVDMDSYRILEEIEYSCSYPGLKTVYRIHEVKCRCLTMRGLTERQDFAFSRDEGGHIVVTYYSWKTEKEVFGDKLRPQPKSPDSQPDPKRRLPQPAVHKPAVAAEGTGWLLEELMRGRETDWARARNAAKRIRDKDYSCGEFFQDCCAAFPELSLYLAIDQDDPGAVTSGRSGDDEYQRTLGALFAVYWLMRLDTDGAQSFTFGVGNDWEPLSQTSECPKRSEQELRQRTAFLEQVRWNLFDDVLQSAGMLLGSTANGKSHDEERTLAMLALTAIHDIMKVKSLLPTVADKHGPFNGVKPGEVINDHDLALGYVLEFRPELLPSFAGLPKAQQESVKFTQCQMEFNMGWLVQAEAPPGQLFHKFKSLIMKGKASPCDIAFYFAHWLTDLAGAQPFPLEGSEMFVLKFPMKVLMSFLSSFSFVQRLNSQSETGVFEGYLKWRWEMHEPSLGVVPSGAGCIARLRLTCMAPAHSLRILQAFEELQAGDRKVLETELARTGCKDQAYSMDELGLGGGPAFLVYYAPALMQKNSGVDALGAMVVLADVLRQARALWPLSAGLAGDTVTVRIDVLKELTFQELQNTQPGTYWALWRTSDVDGMVQKASMLEINGSQKREEGLHRVLGFGQHSMEGPPAFRGEEGDGRAGLWRRSVYFASCFS